MGSHYDITAIKAVVLDVDGVLTDGRIGYGTGSDEEIKFFDVKDGASVAMLHRAGFKAAILSGRTSRANKRRAAELNFDCILEGKSDKSAGLLELCGMLGITPSECLYIGDDMIDIHPMLMAGIAAAVADASPETAAVADWRLTRPGGRGAVREAVERLLKERGLWQKATEKYYR